MNKHILMSFDFPNDWDFVWSHGSQAGPLLDIKVIEIKSVKWPNDIHQSLYFPTVNSAYSGVGSVSLKVVN